MPARPLPGAGLAASLRGVSAGTGRTEPAELQEEAEDRPAAAGNPEKEPPQSPPGSPVASNAISAPEKITATTNGRLLQPLRGRRVTCGPVSPKAPTSQTGRAHLSSEEEDGGWAAPRGSRRSREGPARDGRRQEASRIRLRGKGRSEPGSSRPDEEKGSLGRSAPGSRRQRPVPPSRRARPAGPRAPAAGCHLGHRLRGTLAGETFSSFALSRWIRVPG